MSRNTTPKGQGGPENTTNATVAMINQTTRTTSGLLLNVAQSGNNLGGTDATISVYMSSQQTSEGLGSSSKGSGKCSKCGGNPRSEKCPKCGIPKSCPVTKCPKCLTTFDRLSKNCPKCGSSCDNNPSGNCPNCGSPNTYITTQQCPSCSSRIAKCSKCGMTSKCPTEMSCSRCTKTGSSFNFSPQPILYPERPLAWGKTMTTDTQEVAGDTGDLQRYQLSTPLLIDFRGYGTNIQEFKMHLGLHAKIQTYGSSQPLSTMSDDYNAKIIQYLKTQCNLKTLQLILEIPFEDDHYEYKPYFKVNNEVSTFNRVIIPTPNFKTVNTIPTELTLIHVEMPGLSADFLQEWKYFLDLQTSVRTLICNFGVVLWTFYSDVVMNNSVTLEKVCLRRVQSWNPETKKQEPFDWAIFANCKNLKYLKVTCGFRERWGEWLSYGKRSNQNEIFVHVNFKTLPGSTLNELHYSKFKIDKSNLVSVFGSKGASETKVCKNCPDREYHDGDWDGVTAALKFEMEDWQVEFGRLAKEGYHRKRKQQRDFWTSFLCLILVAACAIAVVGLYVAVFAYYPKSK